MAVLFLQRAHPHLLEPLAPVSAHSTYLTLTQLSPLPSDKEKAKPEITPRKAKPLCKSFTGPGT